MKTHRLARVAEVIREAAANTILFELKDPRVKNVTVTRVEVSADLQHAKIYVSIMGSEQQQQLTMQGLHNAAGFVQSRVARQLTTRFVPHLQFVLDQGVKQSIAVSQLLRQEHLRAAAEPSSPAHDPTTPNQPTTPLDPTEKPPPHD
jgi:ribosome-binding factor A